ncbi:inactive N-acetylated-alpha-linked acidic dipeptidase-like protein 2 [Gastrophryne carolinensis]
MADGGDEESLEALSCTTSPLSGASQEEPKEEDSQTQPQCQPSWPEELDPLPIAEATAEDTGAEKEIQQETLSLLRDLPKRADMESLIASHIGFGSNLMNWITRLYRTPSASVRVNGVISDPFMVNLMRELKRKQRNSILSNIGKEAWGFHLRQSSEGDFSQRHIRPPFVPGLKNVVTKFLPVGTESRQPCTNGSLVNGITVGGKELSYLKFGDNTRTMSELNYMESDEMPSSALELEWDMETELEELGTDSFQADGFSNHNLNCVSDQPCLAASGQLSTSPKGRFQRLEEEPEYFSHSLQSKPKTSQQFSTVLKTCCKCIFIFLLGILVGFFSTKTASNCSVLNELFTSSEVHIINDIINNISKENIQAHYRYFTENSVNKLDVDPVRNIAFRWNSVGLKEVQLVNYSVLLDLPGSSPNTITLKNGQCYYPNGQDCDEETKSQELLYTYAAYSASGTLEGEVIDVQYGTIEDLQEVIKAKQISRNSIALLKLGVLPLTYKLSLLEDIGFGGALLYLDPCDLSEGINLKDQLFMVSLKYGINQFIYDSSKRDGDSWETKPNVTSLLVQPVTISLLRRIYYFSDSKTTQQCDPFKVPKTAFEDQGSLSEINQFSSDLKGGHQIVKPGNFAGFDHYNGFLNVISENITLTIDVRSSQAHKEISNVIGFLRGSLLPDKYIIIGSPHYQMLENSQRWASGAAIMTSLISSIIAKVKTGWRPQRTIIFCSWGGGPFSNFGSYLWGKEFHTLLASNAVAYIGLQKPIHSNGTLHSISSPSLQQLATEVLKKVPFTCAENYICQKPSVVSVQMQGDADFFINQLGIPSAQFNFGDIRPEGSNLLSEEFLFTSEDFYQNADPLFQLHEYIAKVTAQMVLQIATEPVLPFNALDIALEIQKCTEGNTLPSDLVEIGKLLRETAQLFQSNEMRPANDPRERDPIRVRILNDILQNMEKNFLIDATPPGFARNILYRLTRKSHNLSVLQEVQVHGKITKSNETLLTTLQEVLNCISSAQLYFKESLHVFESDLYEKD